MKSRIQPLIIILLIVLNLVCLGFLFVRQGNYRQPPPKGGGKFLTRELDFSEAQKAQLEDLRKTHFQQTRMFHDQLKDQRDAFFREWDSPELIESIADSIGQLQRDLELTTHSHFEAIRAVCTPEQRQKFDQVIREAMRRPPPPRRGKP